MVESIRFDGRVAVITGGGRGLGRAYAELLASRGASVVVNDPGSDLKGEGSDSGPATETVDAIAANGGVAVANFDAVGTDAAARNIIDQAVQSYGRIDILINNAGNFLPLRKFIESSTETFSELYRVHVLGAVQLIREAWPHMQRQSYGKIVITGSNTGLYGTRGRMEYGTAKAALQGLTRCLAHEAQDYGIYVNLIAPGALTRPGTERAGGNPPPELKESFSPGLVAPMVAWLCHEECKANGEMYTAIAGTMARIKTGETPGFASDHPAIEDIRSHFADIRDEEGANSADLTFWDNGETQGMALLQRFGKRR